MIHFIENDALKASSDLETLSKLFDGYKIATPAGLVANGHCMAIARLLKKPDEVINKLDLKESKNRLDKIKSDLEFYPHGHNLSQIYTILHELHWSFVKELRLVNFAFIPADKLHCFEQENLFGDAVFEIFPNARDDIKDAGNCMAADLHTAAAFQLLRIVETGLRKLARKLQVKINKTPLDYAGWESVVKAIDDKLAAKIPKTRGQKKSSALKFKQDLLADFKAYEVTRNEIMHCRWRCNEHEAIGLFNRVRDFMQRLAIQVSTKRQRQIAGLAKRIEKVLNMDKK
jgi:hypothetical protein